MSRPIKRVLIVNCYFPEMREPIKRRNEVPDALAPVLLAGYFSRQHCEVRLYNEVHSGFVEVFEPELLSWPDMIVMTSLTAAFDRLLHLSAYAKTANPAVVTVAGGHAVRCLPDYSKQFFDYACTGDVEQIQQQLIAGFRGESVEVNCSMRLGEPLRGLLQPCSRSLTIRTTDPGDEERDPLYQRQQMLQQEG